MRKAALHGTGVVIAKAIANLLHAASRLGQHVMSLPARQLSYVTSVIVIDLVAAQCCSGLVIVGKEHGCFSPR